MIDAVIKAVAKDPWFWLWYYIGWGILSGVVFLNVAGVWGDMLFFGGIGVLVGVFIWFARKHWRVGKDEK